MKPSPLFALALLAGLVHTLPAAAAGFSEYDVDTRFRAKIQKEKTKISMQNAENFNFNAANGQDGRTDDCGSQQIGNVQTDRRAGPAPREVFVFAPNAINIVSNTACR